MKTETNKSIKTKKAGLLLSTESVNTLKPYYHGLIVWYGNDSSSTLHYFNKNKNSDK